MLMYKNLLPKGTAGKKFFKDEMAEAQVQKKLKAKKRPLSQKISKTEIDQAIIPNPPLDIDPMIKNIIQESFMISRNIAGIQGRDYPLTQQSSFPQAHSAIQSVPSNTLGMSNLNFSPMKLRRVYGRTDTISVLNLTGLHRSHIVYAASNIVIVFDFYENRQSMLQGHKNKVSCLAKDKMCRYFASADVGKDSSIIIWNLLTGFPHKTFPGSHSGLGVISIGFIGEFEHVGTIGLEKGQEEIGNGELKMNELQTVCIWDFAHHEDRNHPNELHHEKAGGHPEAFIFVPKQAGYQRDLTFNEEYPEYFVSTGDKCVIFYTWLKEERRISCHIPKIPKRFMHRMQKFTQSIWMKTCNWCLTGTTAGFVVAWATTVPLGLQEPPNPYLNIKEYKRSFRVGERAITTLTSYKEFFVIGDDTGLVKFFDHKFRVVRWTKNYKLPPINSIQFNHGEELPEFKEEMRENYDKTGKPHAHREKISAVRDYTFGGQKYRQPSQATIERPAFETPDFVIGCEGGSIYYYHLAEDKVDVLIYGTLGQIVTLDTCPNTTHVTMSTVDGDIQMYDYASQALLFSGRIFKKAVEVTCLKFHPSGSFAFFGMKTGQLYFRRSYTWKAMETPLDNCSFPIERIIFSEDGINLAHWDASNTVTLYYYHTIRNSWTIRGKHRSHFQPIVDLAFLFDNASGHGNRLFSLGQDRALIEYDIRNSSLSTGLKILSIFYVEQTNIPTAMVFDSPWPGLGMGPLILFANTNNKIKIYDQNQRKLRRTCQGPNYGTPIHRMISVAPDIKHGRGTKFILLLLGNKIGLMKTPVDGNPFKTMAVLGHPSGIKDAVIGCNSNEIFTSGVNDDCCFMWEPNIQALETCALSGGSGVTPFMQMLDAGLPAGKSLVEDVENIFYHLMLRTATDAPGLFNMNLEIPILEIHTVLRTCGFFPTEFEIDLMMEEAEFLGQIRTGEKPTHISFENFIRLFANHRSIPTLSENDIVKAFEVLGELDENDEVFLDKESFVKFLTLKGEAINEQDLPHFLPNFYRLKEIIDPIDEANEQPAWLQLAMSVNSPPINATTVTTAQPQSPPQPDPNLNAGGNENQLSQEVALRSSVNPNVNSSSTPETPDSDEIETPPPLPISSDENITYHNYMPGTEYFGAEDGEFPGEGGRKLSGYDSTISEAEEMELPAEITARFFIQNILPAEALDTISWVLPKRDEERQLDEIYAERESSAWVEVLQRWKGRDEWRYFKRVFEKFIDKSFPLSKKLRLAIEMDYYCRTGSWPNVGPHGIDMFGEVEEEEEEEGEGKEDSGSEDEVEEEVEAEKETKKAGETGITPEGALLPLTAPVTYADGQAPIRLSGQTRPEKLPKTKHTKKPQRTHPYDKEEYGEESEESESEEAEEEPADWLALQIPPAISEDTFNYVHEPENKVESLEPIENTGEEDEESHSPPFSGLPETPAPPAKRRTVKSDYDIFEKVPGNSVNTVKKVETRIEEEEHEEEEEETEIDNTDDWWDAARHSHDAHDAKKHINNRSRAMSKKEFDEMIKQRKDREGSEGPQVKG